MISTLMMVVLLMMIMVMMNSDSVEFRDLSGLPNLLGRFRSKNSRCFARASLDPSDFTCPRMLRHECFDNFERNTSLGGF